MPLNLIRNDITHMKVDAIVNAANTGLLPGGGVCGAIFQAAGQEELDRACRKIGHCETGQAVITPGFRLPARYVIHTPGPRWYGGGQGEEALLRSCYRSALDLARRYRCTSIAFPLISSGIYGYPKRAALRVAMEEIRAWLNQNEMEVWLIVFDKSTITLNQGLLLNMRSLIDDRYAERSAAYFSRDRNREVDLIQPLETAQPDLDAEEWTVEPLLPGAPPPQQAAAPCPSAAYFSRDRNREVDLIQPLETAQPDLDAEEWTVEPLLPGAPPPQQAAAPRPSAAQPWYQEALDRLMNRMEESFPQMLFRLIDQRGLTDVQVYKGANLDRKLFSKLKKESYHPSRQTVVALAVSLRLSLDETNDLLAKAGYALGGNNPFDVIVTYCISHQIYDIDEINQALYFYDQKLLGGAVG